jgi:hypothetical protein
MDDKGQLVVALPPAQPTALKRFLILYGLVPTLAPIFITYKLLTDKSFRSSFPSTSKNLYSLISSATMQTISKQWYFQDSTLLQKLWKLASAKVYIDKDTQQPLLEYQMQEGYCGSATQRCILKSLGYLSETLPPQHRGESKPESWCQHICQMAKDHSNDEFELSTTIVRGNVSYEDFLMTLREGLANENVRIACNFLRSALTGFEKVRWLPTHLFLAMFGGHFSPILGIIERDEREGEDEDEKKTEGNDDNPFVAIWDTNAKYNGAYFVPARRLYEAVKAIDVSANKPRAIVLVEKKL